MSDRETLRRDFLKSAGLADAARAPLPGDASTRRYERLTLPTGATLMLMDQAPAAESPPADPSWTPEQRRAAGWNATARLSAGRIDAFAAVAAHLRSVGLSAPEVVALDVPNGLAVLEDLGDDLFARVIERGADPEPMYLAAVEAIAQLHATPTPPALRTNGLEWPVQTYDGVALQGGADLFVEWYPKLDPRVRLDDEALPLWQEAWKPVRELGEASATALAHRDYHAENLIWLPDRDGVARAGMIDFQDAVLAHPSWDLHSLLLDVRRDVAPALRVKAIQRYREITEARPDFLEGYAGLGAMNLARILGVFARLIVRDGKPRYREFLPRTWANLDELIKGTGHVPVRDWFRRYVPAEVRS